MYHLKTHEAAKGKYRGILMALGMPSKFLENKHGPCPLCDGGKDRFRFDNKEGRGTYICSSCGSGDGIKLAMEWTRMDFPSIARRIDEIIRNEKPGTDRIKPDLTEQQRWEQLQGVWRQTVRATEGDPVFKYLASRGIRERVLPATIRYAEKIPDGNGSVRPAMVAIIGLYGKEKMVSMHRTFLKPDGSGKAEMAEPRKLMPGSLPEGAAIALSAYSGGPLGIAEGIETAMSASALFQMPVWAAISSSILSKWMPPEGCEEVVIFGDNDPKFGGQAAAYGLAHKLAVKGFEVSVKVPQTPGADWNDVLLKKAI